MTNNTNIAQTADDIDRQTQFVIGIIGGTLLTALVLTGAIIHHKFQRNRILRLTETR